MYLLVRSSAAPDYEVIGVAVSDDMKALIRESVKDAKRNLEIDLDPRDWKNGSAFPSCLIPSIKTEYYIREIKVV